MTATHSDVDTITRIDINHSIKPPSLFNVVYINDDKTPFDFVSETLIHIFGHSEEEAERLTIQVDEVGSAIVATLSFELAEPKVHEVRQLAAMNQFPLVIRLDELI